MNRVFFKCHGAINLWFSNGVSFFVAELRDSPAGCGHVLFQVQPLDQRILYTDLIGGEAMLREHFGANEVRGATFRWELSQRELVAEVNGEDGRRYEILLRLETTLATKIFALMLRGIPRSLRRSGGFSRMLQWGLNLGVGGLLGTGKGTRVRGIYTDGVPTWEAIRGLKLIRSGQVRVEQVDWGPPVLSPRRCYHGELAWPEAAPGLWVEFDRMRRG